MSEGGPDFIRQAVARDREESRFDGKVRTRFPPEPNGYLHIGHAKAITLNFRIAQEFGGACNLRFDDTNPVREESAYVRAIEEDIRWLGFDWGDEALFASDYFEQLYEWALQLIRDGKAFVCDLAPEEVREHRGTLTEPGKESPWRGRSPKENLDLFGRMRQGEFEPGSRTLRARIDMASPNLNLRDPVMYRILRESHHRTGDAWSVYPTYDWAHGQSDSIEGVTHSLCSLEFQDHRPLYDWFLDQLGVHHPRQIEFARLKLSHTVMSKRVLRSLVEEGLVEGWDDPRMPTLCGMRRRGFPAEAVRDFCERIGVAKDDSQVECALLEHFVRRHWNERAPRVMAVLRPLKLVIQNFPEEGLADLEIPVNPEDPAAGVRRVPISRELWIEEEDFREDPTRKYFRLGPDREVRLRGGYFVRCVGFEKGTDGLVSEVRCTLDPETRGGQAPDGRRPKGTIHWLSAAHARPATVRLYDHLFSEPDPRMGQDGDWRSGLNPESCRELTGSLVEAALSWEPGSVVQFERLGYFALDPGSAPERPLFHRTVTLRDTWANIEKREGKPRSA